MQKCMFDGGNQFLNGVYFGDAKGGARSDGFYKQGIAQRFCGLLKRFPVERGPDQKGQGNGDPFRRHQAMGHFFVHTYSGTQEIASDDRDTGQFQKPLYGSVLSVFPVEDGERCVQRTVCRMPLSI